MRFTQTRLAGLLVAEMDLKLDDRGIFAEAFNARAFDEAGVPFRVDQANVSVSAKRGTVRGMHWQVDPYGQTKLVRCIEGRVLDVVVDVRPGTGTYGDHFAIELTPSNRRALLVPRGFAHGWQALADGSEILYLVDGLWRKESERGLRPEDPGVGIPWPIPPVFVSERDRSWPLFRPEGATGGP